MAEEPEDLVDQVDAEELHARDELLEQLLAELPDHLRRVVILYELYGFTLREIAVLEKTSVTRAHARRVAGMKALQEAAERYQREEKRSGRTRTGGRREAFAAIGPRDRPRRLLLRLTLSRAKTPSCGAISAPQAPGLLQR